MGLTILNFEVGQLLESDPSSILPGTLALVEGEPRVVERVDFEAHTIYFTTPEEWAEKNSTC